MGAKSHVPEVPLLRPFARSLLLLPGRVVGWVLRGYEDEPLTRTLRANATRVWDDARTSGKVAGQPVLYLEGAPERPRWVGWGRIVPAPERWRVHGVAVECRAVIRPSWPAVATGPKGDRLPGPSPASPDHDWETPVLGRLLGLSRYRERTPYLDTDARDVRLTARDLGYLLQLQPRLGTLEDAGTPGGLLSI